MDQFGGLSLGYSIACVLLSHLSSHDTTRHGLFVPEGKVFPWDSRRNGFLWQEKHSSRADSRHDFYWPKWNQSIRNKHTLVYDIFPDRFADMIL